MFISAIQFKPWERIWKSWAPGKCKFVMSLVANNKCWTADRLAKRGLLHPELCPLCDQEEGTINHLLLSCVFSRQIRFSVKQQLGLQVLTKQPSDHSFEDWWDQVSKRVADQTKKGLKSVVILVAWSLWNHRNRCVFNGLQPSLNGLISIIRDELPLWELAGARGITHLLALQPNG